MKKIHVLIGNAIICIALATMSGCNKDVVNPTPPAPANEFLTTVILKLVNSTNGNDVQTCFWRQLDPTGATPPDTSKAFLNLKANTVYNGQVIILDETKTPPDTVSTEIKARENYHLFFFQPTPIAPGNLIISNTSTDIPGTPTSATGPWLNLIVNRTDLDTNNPPMQIGLTDNFTTGAASNGRLRVVLRHQPNVKNGTYPPGSSDLDVNYTITIN